MRRCSGTLLRRALSWKSSRSVHVQCSCLSLTGVESEILMCHGHQSHASLHHLLHALNKLSSAC